VFLLRAWKPAALRVIDFIAGVRGVSKMARARGGAAMPLEIKSRRADTLARELATATGEDLDTAVERAIEERLARIPRQVSAQQAADIEAIFDRLARMPVVDERSADEIVGYDANGIP